MSSRIGRIGIPVGPICELGDVRDVYSSNANLMAILEQGAPQAGQTNQAGKAD